MELTQSHAMRLPWARACPLTPHPDLWKRLRVLVLVRFAVAPAIVFGALFAQRIVGIEDLNVRALSLLAGALFLCNVATWLAMRPFRDRRETSAVETILERVLHFSVATDFILLTVALWLVGGPFSPFKAFFVFNVIIASVLLSARAAFAHAFVAFALLSGLVIGTWQGWLPAFYPRGAVAVAGAISGQYVFTVLTVQGLLIMLTALLTTHLMRVLRKSTQDLVETNVKLEHMSQLRRDFLQIALHNLRSPVGAVSMHMNNLAQGYGGTLSEEQQEWVERSQCRLRELVQFLNDLEVLATLETEELEQQAAEVDLGLLLGELLDGNRDLIDSAGHTVTLETDERDLQVHGIPRLIREALANYLTNAVKYTPKGGHIQLRVRDRGGFVRVEVEDSGIGISEADQARLFHELVRIHKEHAALGPVEGSGLGLHIVQRVAEMHGAQCGVHSSEGEGSTFYIEFPRAARVATGPAARYNIKVD